MKIKDVMGAAAKTYKNDQLMTVGVNPEDPGRIPTGIFSFDLASGGGIPLQRISLLWGKEDSMKSTIAMLLVASAQRMYPEKRAVWVDVEGVFSKAWAGTMGVNIDELIYIQPDNAEQVVDMVEGVLRTEDASLVVIDSLAAMVTQTELDKSAEDAIVGKSGLVVNKLYRKVTHALGAARREGRHPTLLVINQTRQKIGVLYGSDEALPGGKSFPYGSSMSWRVYGKPIMENAVSKTLPAYMEVTMSIKKHKVPILAKDAVAQVALQAIPEYGLAVGESYDWNTLLSYLKSLDLFVKDGKKGWLLTNPDTGEQEHFKVQDDLKAKVYDGSNYGPDLKFALIETLMNSDEVIE